MPRGDKAEISPRDGAEPAPTAGTSDGVTKFFMALMEVQAAIPQITKGRVARVLTRSGGTYSYRYADLASILRVVLPILHKHGFVVVHYPRVEGEEVVVRTVLWHRSGHSEAVEVSLRRGDTPQETGSAITYARRYGLQCVLGIAADEDDDAQLVSDSVHAEVEAHQQEQVPPVAGREAGDAMTYVQVPYKDKDRLKEVVSRCFGVVPRWDGQRRSWVIPAAAIDHPEVRAVLGLGNEEVAKVQHGGDQ